MSGEDAITVNVRKLIFTLAAVVAVLFVACGSEPKSDDVVAQTAKVYYDHLLHGQYDHFVDGTYRPDSIPDSYREQLIANARMYVAQQQKERGGICDVAAVGALVDTARHQGNAFVMLTFADSTREEIVVPMVYHNGVWYMR